MTHSNWHRMVFPESSPEVKTSKTRSTKFFTAFNTVLQYTENMTLQTRLNNTPNQ